MLTSKASIPALVQWCRALKHGVDVGVSPVKIFKQQARSGPKKLRPLAGVIAERLAKGQSLEEAFAPERRRFPMLFIELISLGETTGRLTETFGELEQYFETIVAARKQLIASLMWPMIMYVSAIMVIAIMIAILGMVGKWDPLGLGVGPDAAFRFLIFAGMFTTVMGLAFFVVRDSESIRSKIEAFALGIPGFSNCFRAFALQRFAIALHMTTEAGLRADRALNLCFRATANDAYRTHAVIAAKRAHSGEELSSIISGYGGKLFPTEFADALEVGEQSGQIAEVMAKQAKIYREEAVRNLKVLTMLLGGLVYAGISIMIIFVIFKMVTSIGKVYNEAAGENLFG